MKFTNFWPSFNPKESFFFDVLKNATSDVEIVVGKSSADLEIVSVFEKKSKLVKDKLEKLISNKPNLGQDSALANTTNKLPKRCSPKRIWYTGENIRVPFGEDFDHSFSYEQDTYNGTNSYFPLWYTDLNLFSESKFSSRAGASVCQIELLKPRLLRESKKKLACAFVGNSHPMRGRVLQELSKLGIVDVFGKAVGKPVKYKSEVAKDYQYMVCLENDLYPGYVTEKFLEAYISGCVPIYWGDFGSDSLINRNSMINIADFETIDEAMEKVQQSRSLNNFGEMFEQPLFKELPRLENIFATLRNS